MTTPTLVLFLMMTTAIVALLFLISFSGILRTYDIEKVSAYECGFDPFSETRTEFEVHFYLVSLLFLIFDLEVALLFPWGLCIYNVGLFGYIVALLFLTIVTVGYVYEWQKGALKWSR